MKYNKLNTSIEHQGTLEEVPVSVEWRHVPSCSRKNEPYEPAYNEFYVYYKDEIIADHEGLYSDIINWSEWEMISDKVNDEYFPVCDEGEWF